MYMQNYKDILVYKAYRINLDNKLEAYNIFDNTRTYMRACKAIDEYLKTKDRDKLKTDIDSAVKSEQYARFEYESIVTDLIGVMRPMMKYSVSQRMKIQRLYYDG